MTVAERPLDPADYPDADPALLRPGSLVFEPTKGPVDLREAIDTSTSHLGFRCIIRGTMRATGG